ncbi:MAG TPA: MmgE/PrpD family protein [Burkholderiales bacterium]|nr:MmgE/PrpD family protein [Burkholderiales bacterium]
MTAAESMDTVVSSGQGQRAATLSEQLAAHWAGARFEDLPAESIRLAKRFLTDTLAAGVAGSGSEVVTIALGAARTALEGATGSSAIWGRDSTLPAPHAALVNGTAAHALELDDFGGCGHSGAVVIPTVCALAGRGGVSGKAALTAILAGYDVAARVLEGAGGYRPHNDLGWHSTGTCGSFGAAAAAAKLLGLDRERFADALGIAGSFTGGIWAFLADGAMTKRFHPGKAAENGLSAALLAQAGMSGPREVLEAKWGGFHSTYSRGIATPEATLRALGREIRIDRSGMKPYACCRGLHATLDALFEILRETGAGTRDIEAMIVHGNEQNRLQFDRPHIGNLLDAQFSFQYALAVAAVSGRATLDQFTPPRLSDPEVRRLMARVSVVADREMKPGQYPPLEIRFTDGRAIERHVTFAKGAPENPLTDEELQHKAASLLEPVLGAQRCAALLSCASHFERCADMRELIALLVAPARAEAGAP